MAASNKMQHSQREQDTQPSAAAASVAAGDGASGRLVSWPSELRRPALLPTARSTRRPSVCSTCWAVGRSPGSWLRHTSRRSDTSCAAEQHMADGGAFDLSGMGSAEGRGPQGRSRRRSHPAAALPQAGPTRCAPAGTPRALGASAGCRAVASPPSQFPTARRRMSISPQLRCTAAPPSAPQGPPCGQASGQEKYKRKKFGQHSQGNGRRVLQALPQQTHKEPITPVTATATCTGAP